MQAWTNAVTSADGKPVTAKLVHQAVAEIKTGKEARNESPAGCVVAGSFGTKYIKTDAIFINKIPVPGRHLLLLTDADVDAYLGDLRKAYRRALKKHSCIRII